MKQYSSSKKMWISLGVAFLGMFLPLGLLSIVIFIAGCIMAVIFSKQANKQLHNKMEEKYDMTQAKAVNTVNSINKENHVAYDGTDKTIEQEVVNRLRRNDPSFSKSEFKQMAYSYLKLIIEANYTGITNKLKNIETKELYNEHSKQIAQSEIESIFPKTNHLSTLYSFITNYSIEENKEILGYKITINVSNYQNTETPEENKEINTYISYYMEFLRNIEHNAKKVTDHNCPHCTAPIDVNKDKCEFCGNIINIMNNEWKLRKITYWKKR